MTADEIVRLVRILAPYGIRSVKLTGGEPLVRRDLETIIKGIKGAGIADVSIVTNGWFLAERACSLKKAGLDRLNMSLHSLRRKTYVRITGVDGLARALEGLREAKSCGLDPIKLNFTVMRGINDDEIWEMVDFSAKMGVKLQVIELLDMGDDLSRFHCPLDEFEEELRRIAERWEIRSLHARPIYYLPNGAVVEVVKGAGNPLFCSQCTRLRVTADGKFKTCIRREDQLVDFLSLMRSGAGDDAILEAFKRAVSLREPFFKPSP